MIKKYVFLSCALNLSFCLTAFNQPAAAYTDIHSSSLACAAILNGTQFVSLSRSLPLYKQDVNGKCGPTSLGIALGYFGKISESPWMPFAVANEMTTITSQMAKQMLTPQKIQLISLALAERGITVSEPMILSAMINSSETLAATARLYGLYAQEGEAGLSQIATYVMRQEVVLVHWWSGPGPLDDHWSVVQNIGSQTLELRDPWPTSPSNHIKSLQDFYPRAQTKTPGVFSVVRISDWPLLR